MNTQQPFSYEEYWAMQEQHLPVHQARAMNGRIDIDDLPPNPAQTSYHTALSHIATLYNLNELQTEGFDVESMLTLKTETEVIRELEDAGMELTITPHEVERLLYAVEHRFLLTLPKPKPSTFFIRPAAPDESAPFHSIDFERQFGPVRFFKKRYAQKMAAERAQHLARLHSCVSDEAARQTVKAQFNSGIINEYKERAMEASCVDTIADCNRQIQRLHRIWQRTATT